MELKFIEHKEAQEDNIKYERDVYQIGNYSIAREMTIYQSGNTFERFHIIKDRNIEYLPDIYFNQNIFDNNDVKDFKIQTTSYGSLSPEDIQKVIDGYNEAVKVVNVLTDIFLKQEEC